MPRHINKHWWPHQITIHTRNKHSEPDEDQWAARRKWLREHAHVMVGDYLINGDTYCFTNEKDMLYFMLVNQ